MATPPYSSGPTLITVFRDNYEACVRASLISPVAILCHRAVVKWNRRARTHAQSGFVSTCAGSTWVARACYVCKRHTRTHTQRSANTSKAADAVFVMLMHSLLTLHLPACNETGIHVSDLLRFPFSLLSLLGMDRFFVRLLENYRWIN